MTTASTIGPKISPMFTPESMAIQGYSYGYTKRNSSVGDGGEGDGVTKGRRGNVWGRAPPL